MRLVGPLCAPPIFVTVNRVIRSDRLSFATVVATSQKDLMLNRNQSAHFLLISKCPFPVINC